MKVVLATEHKRIYFFSVYAPQTGRNSQVREAFWELPEKKVAAVAQEEMLIVAGDLIGHVGAVKDGHAFHGGFGYGLRNEAGERILDLADAQGFSIVNTRFKKRITHLITFYSCNNATQIDYMLIRQHDVRLITDAKVVPDEIVGKQHRPLICTIRCIETKLRRKCRNQICRVRWWRLKY